MKIASKLIALLILSLFFVANIEAQRRGGTPEEYAKKQTERMTDSLTLSTAQASKVGEINLKYAKLQADFRTKARESEDFDRTAMREGMRNIRKEQKTELKMVLTADQYAKHEKMEAKQRAEREGRRGGERGKREKRDKENRS